MLLIAVASSFRFGFQIAKQTALPLAPFWLLRHRCFFSFALKLFFISY
ncbi:hypothetical protein HPL003_02300 [Paenibacillus terrae HPL-003]|uniref:Uncharacterized protein n=1 Tax=Paenibacillus terrae (strain HPL-003) TaxID=985665 RepID=G7VZJ9_PAETH|nr:hypothetical protein HPL003_02300 [Paenibacillus terrae HPL-003]